MDGKLDEIAVYSGHLVALYCDRHLSLSTCDCPLSTLIV